MTKLTKDEVVTELRKLSKAKTECHILGGAWSKWMPAVTVRKALLKQVIELLEKGK